MTTSVDKKIDDLEAGVKKYASKDTVISIGGYEFTPAKLMVAFTIVSSILGALYGAFETYKDYQSMKKRIAEYVAPDMTEFDKRLDVINKEMSATKETVTQATEYTNNIKNDLKSDIRRVENIADSVERNAKQSQREADLAVKEVRDEIRSARREQEQAVKQLEREINSRIQRALDNPLSNK